MKKNFRSLLLNGLPTFQGYSNDNNSAKKKKIKTLPYFFQEYNKKRDDSSNLNSNRAYTIKNNNNSHNIPQKFSLFKNYLHFSNINNRYPLINTNSLSNNKNYFFNSFNDICITPKIKSKIISKEKYKNNLFISKKSNLLFKSIDINKSDCPKYILLHKIFKNSVKKKKKDNLQLFGGKIDKEKMKQYKIQNDKYYQNYIKKRVTLHYNSNFNSSFVHKIKSEFLINKLSKKYPMKFDHDVELELSDEDDESIQEKKDKLDENILNNEKIFRKIKNLFFNQNKKYIIGNETKSFFDNKENKYNYLYDMNILPNFKNNLLRNNGHNNTFQNKLEEINYIDYKTWRYLNQAKIRLQKLKDDKHFNEYVLCGEEVDLNKEKEKNNLTTEETIDENYKETIKNKYEFYEFEDYLSKKKENQSVVRIIDLKTKKLFYRTFLKMHNSNNNN